MEHFRKLLEGYDCGYTKIAGADFFYILHDDRLYGNFVSETAIEYAGIMRVYVVPTDADVDICIAFVGNDFAGCDTFSRIYYGAEGFTSQMIDAIQESYVQACDDLDITGRSERSMRIRGALIM